MNKNMNNQLAQAAMKALLNGLKETITFAYVRKDGRIRIATGTTNEELLKTFEAVPQFETQYNTFLMHYFDLGVLGWRTVHVDKIVKADAFEHPDYEEYIKEMKYTHGLC